MNVCLNKAVFKTLLGQINEGDYADLEDFKYIDYNVYNSLKFFRDNSLKEHEDIIEQYFTTDVNTVMSSTGSTTIELVPGGTLIKVNDQNK